MEKAICQVRVIMKLVPDQLLLRASEKLLETPKVEKRIIQAQAPTCIRI